MVRSENILHTYGVYFRAEKARLKKTGFGFKLKMLMHKIYLLNIIRANEKDSHFLVASDSEIPDPAQNCQIRTD